MQRSSPFVPILQFGHFLNRSIRGFGDKGNKPYSICLLSLTVNTDLSVTRETPHFITMMCETEYVCVLWLSLTHSVFNIVPIDAVDLNMKRLFGKRSSSIDINDVEDEKVHFKRNVVQSRSSRILNQQWVKSKEVKVWLTLSSFYRYFLLQGDYAHMCHHSPLSLVFNIVMPVNIWVQSDWSKSIDFNECEKVLKRNDVELICSRIFNIESSKCSRKTDLVIFQM